MKQFVCLFCLCLLAACSNPTESGVHPAQGNQYAEGFMLQDSADCCVITIFSPWDRSAVMQRYVLSSNGQDGAMPIVQRLTATSCTHVGMLAALNHLDCLVAMCQPELAYTDLSANPNYRQPYFNLGDAMSPSVERILLNHPDAVMLSVYTPDDATAQHLQGLKIPVIFNNEWTESHPLARAEWIRLVGAFLGCRSQADSVFQEVASRYEDLCQLAKQRRNQAEHVPTICSGQDFRGTWYVPSSDTYMGCLFRDAGADYAYSNTHSQGSIPLTMEQAIQTFADADVWLGVNVRSYDELQQISEKHTWFRAFQQRQVYNFLLRSTPTGANDFWERGVVHPEEILSDLVQVLYPVEQSIPFFYVDSVR